MRDQCERRQKDTRVASAGFLSVQVCDECSIAMRGFLHSLVGRGLIAPCVTLGLSPFSRQSPEFPSLHVFRPVVWHAKRTGTHFRRGITHNRKISTLLPQNHHAGVSASKAPLRPVWPIKEALDPQSITPTTDVFLDYPRPACLTLHFRSYVSVCNTSTPQFTMVCSITYELIVIANKT
jgi:hypothetical protein